MLVLFGFYYPPDTTPDNTRWLHVCALTTRGYMYVSCTPTTLSHADHMRIRAASAPSTDYTISWDKRLFFMQHDGWSNPRVLCDNS